MRDAPATTMRSCITILYLLPAAILTIQLLTAQTAAANETPLEFHDVT
jgi:hypothetical protein